MSSKFCVLCGHAHPGEISVHHRIPKRFRHLVSASDVKAVLQFGTQTINLCMTCHRAVEYRARAKEGIRGEKVVLPCKAAIGYAPQYMFNKLVAEIGIFSELARLEHKNRVRADAKHS